MLISMCAYQISLPGQITSQIFKSFANTMRGRDRQVNHSKSTSALNESFKTGNLLSHPSGMETFKAQSKLIQEQRHRQNDVMMLNKSPHFVNSKRDSDQIQSEIQNVPSDFKRYGEIKIYGWANGQRKQTILPEYRVGQEYSQFDDDGDGDENDDAKYGRFQVNRLNPEESMGRNVQSKGNVFQTQKKRSQANSNTLHKIPEFKKDKVISPFEQNYDNAIDEDQSVNPDFIAYLEQVERRKNQNK